MPFFSSSQNFTINNSQFTDNTTTTYNLSGPSGIDTLLEASCPEAAYDSAVLEYSPQCFPGTREQYIQDIVNWAIPTLGDNAMPIYWMKGPAGVGKTAVARTCAEELRERNKLGAAFFFSISGRKQPEKFFPSIAYQLSTIYPQYYDIIDEKIRRDRTIVKKSMSFQFRYLIDKPLRELETQGIGIGKRVAVIVDGLDECDGTEAQRKIIRIIASAASDSTLPLCWAFFSRPTPHIEATFAGATVAPHCYEVILPVSRDADGDIELYLRSGFENILKRRNASVKSQWPSAEDMKILVDAADGLFIYATTVIRFVNRLGSLGLQKRLHAIIDVILDHQRHDPCAGTSTDAPFALLDAFYTLILQRIPQEIFPSVYLLLAEICQYGSSGAMFMANLLGQSEDEFEAVCNYASAVVCLQDPGKELELDPTIDASYPYTQAGRDVLVKLEVDLRPDTGLGGRVSFYHKSFNDFLLDPARSGSYCIKGSEALAKHYLKMHLDYDRSYCWEGSKLALAPGMTFASSLSYPYTNELVNSFIKAKAYLRFGGDDGRTFLSPGIFGDTECDFRKNLHVTTYMWSSISSEIPGRFMAWGRKCRCKYYPGTQISWFSLIGFNVNEFKSMVKQDRRANIIQHKTREHFESALYRKGHGEKSTFWYWEIDYELGHVRDFETINLAEGEKRFREENFASWPEWEE